MASIRATISPGNCEIFGVLNFALQCDLIRIIFYGVIVEEDYNERFRIGKRENETVIRYSLANSA